jgi:hypothetical protein
VLPALTLAVLVYATSGEEAAAPVRAQLVAALREQGAGIVDHAIDAAIADRRAGWRRREALAFFGEIRALMERGRRARERVELEEATHAYTEAEGVCEAHAAEPGIAALAGEAALERGVALAELRRLDEARAAFALALTRAPGLQLTEKHARPDVVRLFREVQKLPRAPAPLPAPAASDPSEARLIALRGGPDPAALALVVDSLGADAAVVALLSADGRRVLAARVEAGCATAPALWPVESLAAHVHELLEAPCETGAPAPRLDDARLRPPLVAAVAAARRPAPKKARRWPWIVAGAMGVAAAVIGVTVGVVASDPRYTVKVDGRAFGAP